MKALLSSIMAGAPGLSIWSPFILVIAILVSFASFGFWLIALSAFLLLLVNLAKNHVPFLRSIWLPCCYFFALLLLGTVVTEFERLPGKTVFPEKSFSSAVEARIYKVESKPSGATVSLDQITFLPEPGHIVPNTARISLRQKDIPEPGDIIRFSGVFFPPSAPVYPGGFDLRDYARQKNIGAYGYSYGPAGIIARDREFSFSIGLSRLRAHLSNRIEKAGPKSVETEMAKALLVGTRKGLPDETIDSLRKAGLAHILAISGLHIGLVAMGVWILMVRLLLPLELWFPLFSSYKCASLFSLVAAFSYMLLAGATSSTRRAFIMVALVLLAMLFDRKAISMRLLAFAAVIIFILNPGELFNPGFQMSFTAVMVLIAFYEWPFAGRITKKAVAFLPYGILRRIVEFFLGVAIASLLVGVALAPLTLYHFGKAPSYGLLANIQALPILSFWVLPSGMMALLLMPFGAEEYPLALMRMGNHLLIAIADIVASLSGSEVLSPLLPKFFIIPIIIGLVILCLWRGIFRWAGPGLILFGMGAGFMHFSKSGVLPIMMVSEERALFALADEDEEAWLFSSEKPAYVVESWQRRLGLSEEKAYQPDNPPSGISCTPSYCVAQRYGHYFASLRPKAVVCPPFRVTFLVTALAPSLPCRQFDYAITQEALGRHGAHSVHITEKGKLIVRAVSGDTKTHQLEGF